MTCPRAAQMTPTVYRNDDNIGIDWSRLKVLRWCALQIHFSLFYLLRAGTVLL